MKNTRFTPSSFLIGLLLNLCVLNVCDADEIALNPAHPEKYTVVKGDTLWAISGKFLQHPWQWPELWKSNTQIKNPNLIYPNDTIYFTMVNGQPQLSLSRPISTTNLQTDKPCVLKPNEYEKGRQSFLLDKNGKVLPCSRESELEHAITLIPHDKIATFLASPKVVSEDELNQSPYVVGFHEGHLLAGTGDKIYVENLTNTTTNTYTIYRTGDAYHAVETNEVLGFEAKYIATATLQHDGNPATLVITKSTHEIRIGDRIMPSPEMENTLNFFPRPPEQALYGHIIGVMAGGIDLIGLYSIVIIDKGNADGLVAGHELIVYQKGRKVVDIVNPNENEVQLPDEKAGKIMVFRAFEHLSYALVMHVSHDIHRLDDVRTQ